MNTKRYCSKYVELDARGTPIIVPNYIAKKIPLLSGYLNSYCDESLFINYSPEATNKLIDELSNLPPIEVFMGLKDKQPVEQQKQPVQPTPPVQPTQPVEQKSSVDTPVQQPVEQQKQPLKLKDLFAMTPLGKYYIDINLIDMKIIELFENKYIAIINGTSCEIHIYDGYVRYDTITDKCVLAYHVFTTKGIDLIYNILTHNLSVLKLFYKD